MVIALASESKFELLKGLGQFGRWIIYGARSGKQNALPSDALWPTIEKNISLMGFNLGGNLDRVPGVLKELSKSLVYFNDGKGNFERKMTWGPPKSSTRAVAVADFNGDGHLDIADCHEKLGCFVYLNDGKGNLGSGIRFDTLRAVPYSMIAADLNRDGRPEIVVGYVEARGEFPPFQAE